MFRSVRDPLLALWLFAVSAAYYLLYPFTGLLSGLPRVIPFHIPWHAFGSLCCLLLFVVSAGGWGSFFWKRAELSRSERFFFGTMAGFGILSLLVLLLNLLPFPKGWLYPLLALSGVALFLLHAAPHLRSIPSRHARILILLSLPALGSALIGALAPPTQYDSLVYHLALPSRYLALNRMAAESFFFAFPQNLEMLFQAGMKLDGDILANLISWVFLPLGASAIYRFSRRYWDYRVSVLACLFWLYTPALLFISTGTYVDLGLACFVFAALFSFMLWAENGARFWLYWSGAFAGFALGVKYTAALPAGIILFLILLKDMKTSPSPNVLRYAGACAAVFVPWLAKNAVLLHNPIAPWGTAFFPRSLITPETASNYFQHIGGHGGALGGNWAGLLSLPWDLTAHGFRFGGGFDTIGPLFLLFIPALFFSLKIDKISRILLAFTMIFLAGWLMTGKVLRFLVPVLPLFCIFSAQGASYCIEQNWLKFVAYPVLMIGLLHNLLLYHWTMAPVDPYAVVLRGESRESYLERKVPYYAAVTKACNQLPAGSKVLFWGEARAYYGAANAVVPTVFDPHPLAERANASLSGLSLAASLKKDGYTHILASPGEAQRLNMEGRFSAQGKRNWADLMSTGMRTIYQDKSCHLYEIIN